MFSLYLISRYLYLLYCIYSKTFNPFIHPIQKHLFHKWMVFWGPWPNKDIFTLKFLQTLMVKHKVCTNPGRLKEYEILRSPGSRASLLKTGQVYNYCAGRGICLLNRAISPTFLPLYPGHSRFRQMYFPPSSPPGHTVVDVQTYSYLLGRVGGGGGGRRASLLLPPPPYPAIHFTVHLYSSRTLANIASRVIFKRIAALISDHGPILGHLVRCLGFLVLYILWVGSKISLFVKSPQALGGNLQGFNLLQDLLRPLGNSSFLFFEYIIEKAVSPNIDYKYICIFNFNIKMTWK